MQVKYIAETEPTAREFDNEGYDYITTVTYRYDLELDNDLNIVGGEWYTNAHPDFLWTPAHNTVVENAVDQYLRKNNGNIWKKEEGVTPSIKQLAPMLSTKKMPLNAVVDMLFKWSAAEAK